MEDYQLGKVEGRFADIVWQNAPLTTSELIKLCEKIFDWKRTTTYTVLKRCSEKGLFENVDGMVYVRMSKEEFYSRQSENYIEQSFGGSLPGFLAAFTKRKKLSDKDIAMLQQIIEENH